MNRHDNLSDPMLRDALAARAKRMSASTLTASERAARLSALMADSQPATPHVMAPYRRHHHRLWAVASIAASVAVVIAIAAGLLRAPAAPEIALPAPVAATLAIPQPVEGAMVTVAAPPPAPAKASVKRKSRRRRPAPEPVSRHDRILAEIISAETDETRRKQASFDDPYREMADLINSSLAMIERLESFGAEYPSYPSPVIFTSDNEQ